MELKNKRKVLIYVDWFTPAYRAGGPIRSCENITMHLQNQFDFYIFTSNKDLGEKEPLSVTSDTWVKYNDSIHVFYASKQFQRVNAQKKILSTLDFDVLYINSLFSTKYAIIPLILSNFFIRKKYKTIIAPRGMLGKGALQLKSLKKKTFLIISKGIGLFNNVTWQATTELEKEEIKHQFDEKSNILIAENIPNQLFINRPIKKKESNQLNLYFLSRVNPKKNLLFVLELLEKISSDLKINFDIIGPIDDEDYWKRCRKKIEILQKKSTLKIEYLGSLPHNRFIKKLEMYHAMILPTLNENFGHVIVEALSAGNVAIISDQTPWKNLTGKKVGFDLPLTKPNAFIEAIETIASFNQDEYDHWSKNAFDFANNYITSSGAVQQSRELFST